MHFIHIADVHLGMDPDPGFPWSKQRGEEIWESFREIIRLAQEEKPEFLLIAGDLFHRQPLIRELKEVNYLFSTIPDTTVVLMAGNHDYVKKDSYYREFTWEKNVVGLFRETMTRVEIPSKKTAVYGCSYYRREIPENLFADVRPEGTMRYHILLAHGGDARHIPWSTERLAGSGFDYIACGHIHKPEILVPGKMAYAGALEPTDLTQMGPHGYVRGTIDERGTTVEFVPFAVYEYVPVTLVVTEETTQYSLEQQLLSQLERLGSEKICIVTLSGRRQAALEFRKHRLMELGNVIEVYDKTRPAYDLEQLKRTYNGSLIGAYIEKLEYGRSGIEQKALDFGLEALLEARKNGN
ncbi:MAG: exonuclease SbcCD subunit D [Fusicatenibacter sp.]